MIYFFSDLDNTLVYSHRAELPGERVVAEYLNNRAQSFMTKKTFDFLINSREICLIPVTMRTEAQYARLSNTFMKFGCRYALVCNGGILLDNNKIDVQWLKKTREISKNEIPDLQEAELIIRREFPEQNICLVDGIMIYVKAVNPELEASRLSEVLNHTKLNMFYDSRKIYCMPSMINKGTALKRFAEQKNISWSVAAGDSIPDLSMLERANMAILPSALSERIENPQRRIANERQCFSDFICDELSVLLYEKN